MPFRRPPVAPPRGFTLIELLVVMIIAAIAVAFALPDMRRLLNENRMASESNSMLGVLTYARGEALRRNRPVAICISTDGAACVSTVGATGYGAGVIVFENNSGASGSTISRNSSTDTLLRVTVPVAGNARIVGSSNIAQAVIFNPGGDVQQNGSLFVVPLNTVPANSCQRQIELARAGRARVIPVRYTSGNVDSAASYTPTVDCGVAG